MLKRFERFFLAIAEIDRCRQKTWMDLPMRYQPYRRGLYGKLLHLFMR